MELLVRRGSIPDFAASYGIRYGAEWNATLDPGNWQPVADTGSGGVHTFSVPIGGNLQLFMRLKVSSP